ncbi:MAG: hypothetical protein AB1774_05065 [Bacillota bacterium]
MRLESIKGIMIARIVLDELDARLVEEGDVARLVERAVAELSSAIHPCLIERPMISVAGNVLEMVFAIPPKTCKRNVAGRRN